MDELTKQLLTDIYSEEYKFVDNQGRILELNEQRALDFMVLGYKGTVAVRKFRGWKFENGELIIPKEFVILKKQANEQN